MKKGWIVAAVGVGAAAAVFVTPYVVGGRAEALLDHPEGFANLPANVQARSVEYHRHWFDTDAVTEVKLDVGEEKPVTFQLVHHIKHAPFTTLGKWFTVDTELKLPADAPKDAQKAWPDGIPATARTLVDFSGENHSTIQMKAIRIDDKNDHIEWPGASVEIFGSRDGNTATVKLVSQGLQGKDAETNVTVGAITANSDFHRIGALWTGQGAISIARTEFTATKPSGSVEHVSLDKLEVNYDQDIEKDLLHGQVTYKVDNVHVNDAAYSGQVTVAIENLDTGILEGIQHEQERLASSGMAAADRQEALGTYVMQQFPKMLARHPKLALRDVRMSTPQGTITGDIEAQYIADKPILGPLPATLGAINAEANLRVPVALAKLLARQASAGEVAAYAATAKQPLSAQEIAQRVDEAVQQKIDMAVQAGFAKLEGDALTLHATLSGGVLKVNDKDMSQMVGL